MKSNQNNRREFLKAGGAALAASAVSWNAKVTVRSRAPMTACASKVARVFSIGSAERCCFEEAARRAEKETLSYELYLLELSERYAPSYRSAHGIRLPKSSAPMTRSARLS